MSIAFLVVGLRHRNGAALGISGNTITIMEASCPIDSFRYIELNDPHKITFWIGSGISERLIRKFIIVQRLSFFTIKRSTPTMNCTKCGKKIGGFSNYGDSNNPQCFDCSGSVPCASCNNNMPVGESITHENKRICRRCHDKHMAEAATLQKADSYADPFELENIHLDYAAKNFSVHWLINPVIIGLVFVLAGLLGITIFSTLTLDDYFVRIWWYESEGILMILNLVFSILAIGYGIFLCLQPSALFVIQEDYLIYKNKRYYIRDIVSAERTNKKLMLQLGNDVISIPYLRLKTKDVQNFIVHLKGYDKHIEHNRKEKSSRNIGKS